ncbi:autotransporter [Azoarcus olearius]|uniref:Autotransporter n=2 Tax=Azoarcus sp. (strain BH72) TaxID=418699 RepID=A1K615_AZOSB|nr:autotransporter [Azoarcus olearius]
MHAVAAVMLGIGSAGASAIDFSGTQTASGTIAEESLNFYEQSSAGTASITFSSYLVEGNFFDSSSAGDANILVSSSQLYFLGNSTAGNARIEVTNEGQVYFWGSATGGNASLNVGPDGYVVFGGSSGPNETGVLSLGSLSGSGVVDLQDTFAEVYVPGITLRVGGDGSSTSFSGSLYGDETSALVKTGAGTFTLDLADDSFTGRLIVEQGLVSFSRAEGLGYGTITLDGGGLQWAAGNTDDISFRLQPLGPGGGVFDTNGNDILLQGEITGTGALTKTGDGMLLLLAGSGAASYTGGTFVEGGTLAGWLPANTAYTVNGGTLDLSEGSFAMSSLSGTGGVVALGASTLTVNQAGDTTYGGQISGSGGLVKSGAGRLDLTGVNTYTGATEVNAGVLAVNGSLNTTSVVNVNSGGTLGGNGTVGTVVVYSGGTLAPGNSIGALHVAGDLIFTPGSVFSVETDAAGNADQVIVAGMVSLDGTLQVLAGSGSYAPATNYAIISTTSGSPISGTFSNVTSNLAFLDPSLSYTASGVTLTMTRNDVSFASQALTPNQLAFANSIASIDPNSAVYRTLVNLSGPQAAAMYEQLSGDAHASMSASLVYSDIDVINAPLHNLRANLDSPGAALPMWTQMSSGTQRMNDDGNAGATTQDFDGALIGGDLPAFGDWRVGAAIGYDIAQVSVGSRQAEGETKTRRFALYSGKSFELADGNSLRVFGGAAYSLHRLESARDVSLIDGVEHLTRGYDVVTRQLFGELAYRLGLGEKSHVEPFVGLMRVAQRADGFQEEGGSAALAGDSQRNALLISTLGARGQHAVNLGGLDIELKGSVTWRHLEGDVRPELGLRLSGGARFTVMGTELPRDSMLLTLNANYDLMAGVVLNVGVNAMTSDSGNAAALVANLRWKMN